MELTASLRPPYEREPGWFPLIARAAPPQALLSFRYIDGIYLRISFSTRRRVVEKNKVMAGGTPANPATPVGLKAD
jgi:hypothetical protein